MTEGNKWNVNCRFFNEDYACETLTSENLKSCEECKFSSPYSKKILIIKLGALGDVLRTTPILPAIKEKYPNSLIYWLIEDNYGEGKELLKNNPYIDKVLILNTENILRLQQERFDILYSLEITTPATLLANIVQANEKYGYYFNNGATFCFNNSALEYLETAFLSHIKKQNRKTYQELIFLACNLPYNKEEIIFNLKEKDKKYAEDFKKKIGEGKILGINFGSGKRWPSKAWSKEKIKELIKKTKDKYKILLLGGPEEETIKAFSKELENEGTPVIINDPKNSTSEFASILDLCDKIITTDSFTLHLATALKKPTIALFFSTPDWEIEDYGIIKKLTSPLLEKNFFSNSYSDELANSISVEDVLNALQ